MMRWYTVITSPQTPSIIRHLGLCGDPWPLDPASATRNIDDDTWELIWVGGCSFEVCTNAEYAKSHFDLALDYYHDIRLIEATRLVDSPPTYDGIDIGAPCGGFSAAGEICANRRLFERYGTFLNDKGLFGSESLFNEYLEARHGRELADGIEYLDESLACTIRVLRTKNQRMREI